MDEGSSPGTQRVATRRVTLAGDGRLGPIEERIGRRLVRLVDPESAEGEELLGSGSVDLIGPEGERFGRIPTHEACRKLRERLERRLETSDGEGDDDALREGLSRLATRSKPPLGRS